MKTTLQRAAVIGIAVPALVISAPAAAMADAFFKHTFGSADADGAVLYGVRSVVDDDGNVRYEQVRYEAGPDGASVERLESSAD
ncbi:hypothetical protein HDA32_001991 [Spinactinospora alkalitolerans]|uniref:Uncharacterized protein n=1 Tax=Spinactinospora alkalitolerans TaxID=687207 RepID=A0A852TT91_9ACTN|nr:hypothetical protein [Spinactinospora alkalitolerans]NYE46871.1 hypothetical protein [Spinactinospora alkalitolerans]